MRLVGYNQVNLTSNAATGTDPSWCGNERLTYVSDRDGNLEIYIMLADGSEQTRLTENFAADTDPSCSPSGNQIAYTSTRDGNKEVYVMNLNGSAQQRLTTNDASDGRPAWSPDGTQIVFGSDRDGNQEIYLMNTDGSGVLISRMTLVMILILLGLQIAAPLRLLPTAIYRWTST